MHKIKSKDLRPGTKVKLKTLKQLKLDGWYETGSYIKHPNTDLSVNELMIDTLGQELTIENVYFVENGEVLYNLVGNCWNWNSMLFDSIVSTNEKETVGLDMEIPYYGVKNDIQSAAVENSSVWDKKSIQRTFEDLEKYFKGYNDGFERAIELIKETFGVEV